MEFVEFTGKNTEDALNTAQEHFALPLDRLEIEVVRSGSVGIFGLGSKKAIVKARPAGLTAQEEMAEVLAVVSGEAPPAPRPAPAPPARDDRPAPEAPAATAPSVTAPPAQTAPAPAPAPSYQSGPPEAQRPPAEPPSPELVQSAGRVLTRLVQAMEPDSTVEAKLGERGIELDIIGGETGIIIGRRGQTLEALQYLTTRIISHEAGRAIRISVDAGGYRQRRFDSLAELAQRMGEKARETGRPVSVGPLNSQERRVVHMALRGSDDLSTVSRGRGDLKKVVISPR